MTQVAGDHEADHEAFPGGDQPLVVDFPAVQETGAQTTAVPAEDTQGFDVTRSSLGGQGQPQRPDSVHLGLNVQERVTGPAGPRPDVRGALNVRRQADEEERQRRESSMSRRRFLGILGLGVGAAAVGGGVVAAVVGGGGSGGSRAGGPITAATGKNGEILENTYAPGTINLTDDLYHPPAGDRRGVFAQWQGKDIIVAKPLGLVSNGPGEAAASALQLLAVMLSCPEPPDGGQVPLYFSDDPSLRDQFAVRDSLLFRKGSPNGPDNYDDQVLIYDTEADAAIFGEGVDADGNRALVLLSGTLCFQRKHGGDWQTLDGRDPAKAQLVRNLTIGFQASQDGQTFTVRSFTMNPPLENFLTKLRA